MKKIHRGQSVASYWLSGEPERENEIGLKALINFDTKTIGLIEESIERKEAGSILMNFEEFKNLQTIIEERK